MSKLPRLALLSLLAAGASASNLAATELGRAFSFESIEFACRNRYTNDLAKGICWGYISGLVDANLTFLNIPGKRVLCIVANGDKDKIIDRIFSYVDAPKDKKLGADPFFSVAIIQAFICDR